MKNIRKSVIVMLIGVMLFHTFAYANDNNQVQSIQEERTDENEGIMPLYTYLNEMSVGLYIDENGRCVFSGSATAFGYKVKLEIYLQRSRNQLFWDSIMGGIKTVDQSGAIEYSLNLQPDDYFYRTKVVVSVLDNNKNVIETQTAYSSTERY